MTEGVWSQEQEDEPGHQATERELCVGCDLEEELGCDSELKSTFARLKEKE